MDSSIEQRIDRIRNNVTRLCGTYLKSQRDGAAIAVMRDLADLELLMIEIPIQTDVFYKENIWLRQEVVRLRAANEGLMEKVNELTLASVLLQRRPFKRI